MRSHFAAQRMTVVLLRHHMYAHIIHVVRLLKLGSKWTNHNSSADSESDAISYRYDGIYKSTGQRLNLIVFHEAPSVINAMKLHKGKATICTCVKNTREHDAVTTQHWQSTGRATTPTMLS